MSERAGQWLQLLFCERKIVAAAMLEGQPIATVGILERKISVGDIVRYIFMDGESMRIDRIGEAGFLLQEFSGKCSC